MAKRIKSNLLKLKAPIEGIVWRDPNTLDANDYNPNVVITQEMELLKLNIERIGWLQPILITEDDVIIDGYHRTTLSRLNGWLVPCVVLKLPPAERMILTIRINRAKGTHVALKMSELAQKILATGITEEYLAESIGATMEEIRLLKAGDIFKALDLSKWKYGQAWIPKSKRGKRIKQPEYKGR